MIPTLYLLSKESHGPAFHITERWPLVGHKETHVRLCERAAVDTTQPSDHACAWSSLLVTQAASANDGKCRLEGISHRTMSSDTLLDRFDNRHVPRFMAAASLAFCEGVLQAAWKPSTQAFTSTMVTRRAQRPRRKARSNLRPMPSSLILRTAIALPASSRAAAASASRALTHIPLDAIIVVVSAMLHIALVTCPRRN